MKLEKWHALGNGYLLVERDLVQRTLTPDFVRRVCDRHSGVGSDGLLEILAVEGARADFLVWNPDGSSAEFSGNGARIVAAWLAGRSGEPRVHVSVRGRTVAADVHEGGDVVIDVGRVDVARTETIVVDGEAVEFVPVSVGNPHAVIRREPERGTLLRLGPRVERHPRFPDRTNVQLVRVDGPHELTVGIWERGAGETLSSGTSSVSAAAAAVTQGWCESPVTVHLAGGDLHVELRDDGTALLTGPAEQVGVIELAPAFADA
jgi:diaminopimelate epimerase